MNLPRYKFSKECEEDLIKFFKVVSKNKPAVRDDLHLWKTFLPMDKEMQQRINSYNTTTLSEEIIIDSDEEKIEIKEKTINVEDLSSLDQTIVPETQASMNVTAVEDMIDGVEELLQIELTLNKTVIQQIANEFSSKKLQNMFISFSTNLNSECALKLWTSIINTDRTERNIIVPYFLKYVLVKKILHEHNDFIKELFKEAFDEFPNETSLAVRKILFENSNVDLTVFKSNLNALSDDHKNITLSIFKDDCQKLKLHHLSIIHSLLTPSTNSDALMKIIESMCQVAKEFSSDKCFGKLLLDIIQSLGSNVVCNEQQLRYIILNHKSVFKAKIVKLFDSCLQDHKIFSQSFTM